MSNNCVGRYTVLEPRMHVSATLGLYAVLLLVWATVRLTRIQPLRPQCFYHWIIAVLTPVSAILFFIKLHAGDLDIDSCSFMSTFHIVTLIVDFVFFLRLLVELLEAHVPEPIPSLTEVWLLVNTVWKISRKVVVSEYHFLVLFRFIYPQTLELFSNFFTRLCSVSVKKKLFQLSVIIIGVLVFAGAVQTAEEWSQMLGIHPDEEGQATSWRSYWDYIYMGYVTASTVGYGDMTPSTVVSQILVIIAIVLYISWFGSNCEELFTAIRNRMCNVGGRLPPLSRSRRVVVVGCLEEEKMMSLLNQLAAKEETQIIVGVGREEPLSLQQIPGVFVVSSILNKAFFTRCFPKLGKNIDRSAYTLMILNQQGDADGVEARNSDLYVLSLAQLVKLILPKVPLIIQVWRSESVIAVQNVEGWNSDNDQVLCVEEILSGLMLHAAAADGAASILASFISSPCCSLPPVVHACTEKKTKAHYLGQSLVLSVMNFSNMEYESFERACIESYLQNGILLLGYVEYKEDGAYSDRCFLLPPTIPPNVCRIALVPSNMVAPDDTIKSPLNDYSNETKEMLSDIRPANFTLNEKTVLVVKDGPGGCITRGVSRSFLNVLTNNDKDVHYDAAVLFEPESTDRQALYNYYSTKADLLRSSPWVRLITNVENGMKPGVWKLSVGCPYASTSYVNPHVMTSALSLVCRSGFLFGLWKFLVEECSLVEVEVKDYCNYGAIIHTMLSSRWFLPLGATIQMSSHSSSSCCRFLNLDPDNRGSLAVTNPDSNFCLHPGDKVVAFPFKEEVYSL